MASPQLSIVEATSPRCYSDTPKESMIRVGVIGYGYWGPEYSP